MAKLPEKTKQIAQVHAQLINSVVMTCQNKALLPQLEPVLKSSENNGWIGLMSRIRKIIAGSRSTKLLRGLDEEDAAIVLAILVGLQDPSQIPKIVEKENSKFAAPGLAAMIDAAAKGDVNALSALGDMAEQMALTEGSMRSLSSIINLIIKGERDLKILTRNMDEKGEQFVESLLQELAGISFQ
jgi:hypothetical protein